RQEIHLKLLEIHAQHNKPSAFETVAAELYSVSQGKGEAWQKAVSLGRQLDPNNPMYGEGGAAAAAAAADAAGAGKITAGGAARGAPFAKPRDDARGGGGTSPAIAQELASDSALDFRFDEDVSISRTGNTTKAQIEMINAAEREFEESAKKLVPPVSSGAGSQEGSAEKAASVVAAVAAAAKGLAPAESTPGAAPPLRDLDFHFDEEERPAARDSSAARADEESPVSPALARPKAAIDLDKLDLNFGPDHSTTFEDPTPSALDGQWHDAATKLDLAKAYQEMGDVEGAREILQEVLHEGDDTQKSEAQVLLAKLG
ncbi:MAG: hypothetical protein OEW98_10810, partial [Betaproteobacteria bacterium]|nr:hypothetical protein [Betaproteobacteria bacterium]